MHEGGASSLKPARSRVGAPPPAAQAPDPLKAAILPSAQSGADVVTLVREAGLRHVSPDGPGIARVPQAEGFAYLEADGKAVRDAATLERIAALAIPPAWNDVWICPSRNGHLQAVGRDARGRKQYRYHARWRALRDEVKYGRMLSFGQALPRIRSQVEADLALPGLPREKILATIVTLLQATMMRIGNEEYARVNKSFGLTTLRNRHARIEGPVVEFQFRGKSGVRHCVRVNDRRLARIVRQTRDLPGQDLFQYAGEDAALHTVGSADVNEYLRAISGEDYTAKDFRTWYGTVLAALALRSLGPADSPAEAKKHVAQAVEAVARQLGNTAAICRKCYVHPAVLEAYEAGELEQDAWWKREAAGLAPEEAAVLAFLRARA
ncbi:MAG: DNA topoisomerase IB [Noviherbaspirillum sp.]